MMTRECVHTTGFTLIKPTVSMHVATADGVQLYQHTCVCVHIQTYLALYTEEHKA